MNVTELERLPPEQLLAGEGRWLTPEFAADLAAAPLAGISREFPHYVGSVDSADGPPRPRDRHPIFFGCYDWHSAVHSHWTLLRLSRLEPGAPFVDQFLDRFDERLTPSAVGAERVVFEDKPDFERPYGWAWFLMLMAEIRTWEHALSEQWVETLAPLETQIRELVIERFLAQSRPFRVGTHGNSAFALGLCLESARRCGDEDFASKIRETAQSWYGSDSDAPVKYEPLGWDFLSPTLTESRLLDQALPAEDFQPWFEEFLPTRVLKPDSGLLTPPAVPESPDSGAEFHLVGLALSKTWALADLAMNRESSPEMFWNAACDHLAVATPHVLTDDYAGSHWLPSFLVYLGTRNVDSNRSRR